MSECQWSVLSTSTSFVKISVHLGGTAAAAPPPFRPGNPALCGSHPLVTPYYYRLGDLLCFVFIQRSYNWTHLHGSFWPLYERFLLKDSWWYLLNGSRVNVLTIKTTSDSELLYILYSAEWNCRFSISLKIIEPKISQQFTPRQHVRLEAMKSGLS